MITIAKSPVEDRYIAYLAGAQKGINPITNKDRNKAYCAQKHPVSNKIASSIIGLLKGGFITSFGLATYPLVNQTMKASIFGSTWEVCSACGAHGKALADLIQNIHRFVDPQKAPSYLGQKVQSYLAGLSITGSCVADKQNLINCRIVNYLGSIAETLSKHSIMIGSATAGLVTFFAYAKMNSYLKQERAAEEELIDCLTNKFGKIATRLTALGTKKSGPKRATDILLRRLEINKEVENLHLPSLAWKDIEHITQPVFEAAQNICYPLSKKTKLEEV